MRQIVLRARPEGSARVSDFEINEVTPGTPGSEEVSLRLLWMSVDPYMRGRMRDAESYVPPFELGEPIMSNCVAEVVASNSSDFAPGELVLGQMNWREEDIQPAKNLVKVPESPGIPIQHYLGALGMPGLTAYVGLFHIGGLNGGETVFVSGAAGAVGSLVGQIAKLKGCRVIGSAGSPEKVTALKELGFDGAFCYRSTSPREALRSLAPQGIDFFFDNVGGEHLAAAIASMNNFSTAVLCGAISQYNQTESVPGPPDFATSTVRKRLRFLGFIVSDHWHLREEFLPIMSEWILSGQVQVKETVFEGFEKAPEAFLGLFRGDNLGKMLVRV